MKNLLILITLFTINLQAQNTITFSALHDAKLLVLGDDHGNPAGTTNVIFDMNWEGNQFEWYYFSIQSQFEYADLSGGEFYRYSVSGIWTLNQLFIKKLEASFGIGIGMINRQKSLKLGGLGSYSATSELAYPITQKISILAKYEIVHRSDLVSLWNEKQPLKPNFAIGLKFKPFK